MQHAGMTINRESHMAGLHRSQRLMAVYPSAPKG